MDRNGYLYVIEPTAKVALRKESVDRNSHTGGSGLPLPSSLSARRAWIEIHLHDRDAVGYGGSLSARRAWIEIFHFASRVSHALSSLSARRAWIEIYIIKITQNTPAVALRKESVDRNSAGREYDTEG